MLYYMQTEEQLAVMANGKTLSSKKTYKMF